MRVHLLQSVRRVDDVEHPDVLIFVDHFVKFRGDNGAIVSVGSDWGTRLRVRTRKDRSEGRK